MRSARTALLILSIAAATASCARVPRPASPAPPGAPPGGPSSPGYDARRDSLAIVDPAVFAGRRVALDPGHGGFFRGALGVNGTTEAEVNLGVALELARMLEGSGATVLLTRDRDRDFLAPADSALRTDLAERVRLINSFQPDVLVSIHHNADPKGRHDVNETVTYYKLGDDGPSLELGESIHRALVRNVGIPQQRVSPGNFAVVRGSEAPAVLTETSYITNPDVEARLRLPEKQKLEAEALYLGLGHYFSRNVPVIEAFALGQPGLPQAQVYAGLTSSLWARVRGAFDRVELRIDGVPVTPGRADSLLWWTPDDPLPAGTHEATLRVALAGEGTSQLHRVMFGIDDAPLKLHVDFSNQLSWDGRQPLGVRVRVEGQTGHFMADSVSVRLRDDGSRLLAPADTVIHIRGGEGWGYFRRSGRRPARRAPSVQIRAEITPPLEGESGPIVEPAIARLLYDPKLQPFWKTGFARSMPADTVLRDAVGTTGPNAAVRWINRDGFVQLPEDSVWLSPRPASAASAVRIPALAGYRMPAENGTWPPRLVALLGGALHGKRIVLDPDGGGDASGGTGASGARGASLALAVCRALAGFLAAAGADVRLTREGDASVSEVERVQISEAFRADRFLRVGFRADAPQLGHYFSSAAGKRWAERTRLELERLSLPAPPAGENVQYPITQTSCVAMAAMLGRIDDPATEERLLSTGTLRASAYALFLGLAREFSSGEAWPLDSIAVRDEEGRAVAGAAVSIGALVLETDALGRARFARTELGALEVAVDDSRIRARGVLLDSARAFVLTGPRDR